MLRHSLILKKESNEVIFSTIEPTGSNQKPDKDDCITCSTFHYKEQINIYTYNSKTDIEKYIYTTTLQ